MTMRLSIISFAGMVRTLVAVGTVSDSSMFFARVLVMPLRTVTVSSSDSAGCAALGFATGYVPTAVMYIGYGAFVLYGFTRWVAATRDAQEVPRPQAEPRRGGG